MLLRRRGPADRERAMELLGQALVTTDGCGMTSLGERVRALRTQAEAVTAG
jgi:hypothetical protein